MKRNDTRQSRTSTRPPQRPIDSDHDYRLQKRKSLRLRPSELLENAEPPSPLKDASLKSAPASAAPEKMSLFNLFSRPKVERARGHTEKGLEVPVPPRKSTYGLKSSASSPNLVLRVQSDAVAPPTPTAPSVHTPVAKPNSRLRFREPSRNTQRERKPGSFEPPPLFQAYPQSMKDGTLELSLLSAETVQQKSKSRKGAGLHADLKVEAAQEDTFSLDTKRSTIAHFKHVANGSVTHSELPRKIFVLATSGYLLQYAESGPSDRLPERMLQLGKDSAAFACDLVPGKHHVLQVSHAVDEDGILVISSASFLSKLGIRSAAAKRMTSNILLVMPSAREMESWMVAIRKNIEAMGGTNMQVEISAGQEAQASGSVDLRKTPSQSHRYKVQRDPNAVTPVTSPTETPPPIPSPSPQDKSDTATIDGIEMEASKLTGEDSQPPARTRSPSDAPSVSSSAAVSVDQQQLDNLRSSGSNKRFSRASQAPTVATTVTNSRANSLTGSPPSEGFAPSSLDAVPESATRPPYRMLNSYSGRRRSAAPSSALRDAQSPPGIDTSPQKIKTTTLEQDMESPVVGKGNILLPASPPSASKRLSIARSEPNMHGAHEKHDSKVPLPPIPQKTDGDRPESFVGDLPPPSTWSSNRVANRRVSTLQSAPMITAQAPSSPKNPQTQSQASPEGSPSQSPKTNAERIRPKRMSTFSIPLKVNPSTANGQPAPIRSRRRSSAHDPDPPGDTPVVHALAATIEPNRRASVATTSMASSGHSKSPSQRLSLFPSQLPTPPAASPGPSPPGSAQQAPTQAQQQANMRSLRRPTSMQVRSDHAPFLSSVRNSTGPPNVRNFTAPAAPIRGLKPSRSASNVPSVAVNATDPQGPSTDALKDLDFGLPPPREDDDKPMPLPSAGSRSQSPMPPNRSGSGSRMSMQRGIKSRSSLPELDLGMPTVALGPPAPPPSAPLPPPPTNSRPGSRLGSSRPNSPPPANGSSNQGIDSVAGLGIRVS